jgi:hypothetical protein
VRTEPQTLFTEVVSPQTEIAQLVGVDSPGSVANARRTIRTQIAALERELSAVTCELDEHFPGSAAGGVPRLLDLAQLEQVRDRMVARLTAARARLNAQEEDRAQARQELERIRARPADFPFARISLAQLGLPGCGDYAVRPRLGLIGMLAGWWEVKLSSGCP